MLNFLNLLVSNEMNSFLFLFVFNFFNYCLDMSPLICEHNLLKYNPIELVDYCYNPVFQTRVIKKADWKKIKELYV